jgi:nitrite reductase/ring-hydroxylating ferredoxin subunit
MPPAPYQWHKIAESALELPFGPNQIAVITIRGKNFCIGSFGEDLYAFSYKCPHASGIMADGYIDPLGNVVCPVHRYRFNLKNGRNTSGEGFYLRHWPVEKRPEGVFIGLTE